MKSKKADLELKNMVTPILVIALIILSTILAFAIGKASNERAKRDTCTQSLKMSAIKLQGLADEFGNPVDIKCYTEYENYKTDDEQEIKKIIADKMVECWDQYGKGELEIFDTKDANYCVVCSRLTFENEAEISGFTSFLNNNIAPMKKMSYLEYLSGVSVRDYDTSGYEGSELNEFDNIPINESLAVMFTMGKNANPDAWKGIEQTNVVTAAEGAALGTILGAVIWFGLVSCPESAGIGCAVAGVATIIASATGVGVVGYSAGASRTADWDARVIVWPYDKLNELNCNYIEGQTGHLEIKQMD